MRARTSGRPNAVQRERSRASLAWRAFALGLASRLAITHEPLRTLDGTPLLVPELFLFGFWLALVIGIGFIVAHMVGNLKMYLGIVEENGVRDYDLDIYGEYLRQLLVPIMPEKATLWLLRLVLIGAVILHVHAAVRLAWRVHRVLAGLQVQDI